MNFLNRFFKTITRPRFVITLIVLTFIAALLGAFIPQVSDKSPSYFEEWKLKSPKTFYIVNLLQLNRVYTSVWFLSLVFIIMLSLGYSLYSQVRRNLKRKDFTPPAAADWDSIDAKTVIEQESLMRFMRKKRYKLVHDKKMSLRGAERRSNFFFHFPLIRGTKGVYISSFPLYMSLTFYKKGVFCKRVTE